MHISITEKKDNSVEILASENYSAIPVLCHGFYVLRAGTPLTASGTAALDGSGAEGVLLYDVDPTLNPVGSLVVCGVIDYEKAKANAGITATAAKLQEVMPRISFRTAAQNDPGGDSPVVGQAVVGKAIVA